MLSTELLFNEDVDRRVRLCDEALAIARRIDDPAVLAFALASRNLLADFTETGALDAMIDLASEMIEGGTLLVVANGLRLLLPERGSRPRGPGGTLQPSGAPT